MPSNNFTRADKPFDSAAKADIIVRSSDNVDFFVLKSLLTLVSSVFDGMLSQSPTEREAKDSTEDEKHELPITLREDDGARRSRFPCFSFPFFRRRGAKANHSEKNGLPIIQLVEDSNTLYNLLLLIYPYSKDPPRTVEVYLKVGAAARKYRMDEVEKMLRNTARRDCMDALATEPLRAFALASHFGWVDVMKIAARNTLKFPLGDLQRCEELRLLSGVEYHELVQFRLACRDAVQSLLAKWDSQTTLPECRIALTRLLREKLEVTDCPWIVPDIEDVSGLLAVHASTSPHPYSEVIKNCGLADVEIDKVLSTVPLKVKGVSGALTMKAATSQNLQKRQGFRPYETVMTLVGRLTGHGRRFVSILDVAWIGRAKCYRGVFWCGLGGSTNAKDI